MFMMLFPQLCWMIALDTMGLSALMGSSQKPIDKNVKDE